ncbi:MAG: sigma 54-interacting transcriptional regulator [Bradymonadia bacterium]|jgi:DNA-binding NtrC family response regulator
MAHLVVRAGPDEGRVFALEGTEVVVGRGEGVGLQLGDPAIARQQFRLVHDGHGWRLVDLGARSRTIVNGVPVTDQRLQTGDEVQVGVTCLTYAGDAPRDTIDLLPRGFDEVVETCAGLSDEDPALVGVSRFAARLGALSSLAEVEREVPRALRTELGAHRAFLFTRGPDGTLETAAWDCASGADARVAFGQTLLDLVFVDGKSVLCVDVWRRSDASTRPHEAGDAGPVPWIACAPVRVEERLYGMLAVGAPASGTPHLGFLTALAQQVGLALGQAARCEALARENAHLRARAGAHPALIGRSAAMAAVLRFVEDAGQSDAPALIIGEAGTGRTLVAASIHALSRRARGPFVVVRCAAFSEAELELELFGDERDAVPGARSGRMGRVEAADGGTLLLVGVETLGARGQTRLLHGLEASRWERVGGARPVRVDVRVLVATDRDLHGLVDEGRFRADLCFRCASLQVAVPPLRERADDLPALVGDLVRRLAEETGHRIEGLEPEVLEALAAEPWPGNVRALKNALERAVLRAEGPVLRRADLLPALGAGRRGPGETQPSNAPIPLGQALPRPAPRSLRALERDGIVAALAAARGNKAQAARILEVDRGTLYKKIKDYDL